MATPERSADALPVAEVLHIVPKPTPAEALSRAIREGIAEKIAIEEAKVIPGETPREREVRFNRVVTAVVVRGGRVEALKWRPGQPDCYDYMSDV